MQYYDNRKDSEQIEVTIIRIQEHTDSEVTESRPAEPWPAFLKFLLVERSELAGIINASLKSDTCNVSMKYWRRNRRTREGNSKMGSEIAG